MKKYSLRSIIIGIFIITAIAVAVSVYFFHNILTSVAVLITGAAVLFWALNIVINSLKQITEALLGINSGKVDIQSNIVSKTEIGDAARAFNKAAENFKISKMALEDEKAALETRIKDRTRDLQLLAGSLEDQVKARTGELQAKIEELERFRRLAVGREIKMVELKRQIQELSYPQKDFTEKKSSKDLNNGKEKGKFKPPEN